MTAFAFSCLVDEAPVFAAQAMVWVNCLKRIQSVGARDIFVHVIGEQPAFVEWLRAEAVNIVQTEPFKPRHPYCNKLQQLATFASTRHDQIILMDCDTAWLGDGALPRGAPVAARIVDEANPPAPVLEAIFSAAGLAPPDWSPVWFSRSRDREFTDHNNCNGGLYICDREFLATLAPVWRDWALWSLDNLGLFASAPMHVDQVSFALAMRKLNAKVHHLDLIWNYPTHISTNRLPDTAPLVIHYHDRIDRDLNVQTVGLQNVDRAIDTLNTTTRTYLKAPPRRSEAPIAAGRVNGAIFRSRFLAGQDVPSVTSAIDVAKRGHTMAVIPNGLGRAFELGCGEGHLTRLLANRVGSLTATDASEAALRRAAERCREKANVVFRPFDCARDPPDGKFDLVVAGDVFDNLGGAEDRRTVAERIVEAVRPGGWLVLIEAACVAEEPDRAGREGPRNTVAGQPIGGAFAGCGLVLEQELKTAAYRIRRFRRAPPEAVLLPPLMLALPLGETPGHRP